MAITLVQDELDHAPGYSADTALAFSGNVTAGNIIVVQAASWRGETYIAGDCTKTAGTATLGSFTLDKVKRYTAADYQVAIWSAPVTGTGSCTITLTHYSSDYLILVLQEWSGLATSDYIAGTNDGSAATGGPITGTVASGGGGVFIGVIQHNADVSPNQVQDAAFTANVINDNCEGSGQSGAFIYRIVTSDTTDAAELTAPTTTPWEAVLVVYKVVAGAAGRNPVAMGFVLE